MEKMIAFCGIDCAKCLAVLATENNDDNERKNTAELWSKQYHAGIKPEDINCEGCLSKGEKIFSHCKVCEIRKCGQKKNVENCAHCEEYACGKLDEFFKIAPDGRTVLDEIKKGL
ncbi:DUF3795 domain-containing protein [archaeon]|nr:DUF3795 domain-containing protein [archaeon]